MKVAALDERHVVHQRTGGAFVVHVYRDGDHSGRAWAVDRYLLTDADLPAVLAWLRDILPVGCCWSLGVVQSVAGPTAVPGMAVAWIVGADVLTIDPARRTVEHRRLADEMLARRHRVTLP